jgi:peptide/nickel transport system ATP-binding protein
MSLAWRNLKISFGPTPVVDIDHLELADGEILGLVGESGSGKSLTALATLGLTRWIGAEVTGSITLDGSELVGLSEDMLRSIRGRRVALIMQNPSACFNPVFRVGDTFTRALRAHGLSRSAARTVAERAMDQVVLARDLLRRYPHQLSGGQSQRMAIALAVALEAEVILADEPTSALDVTVQAEILEVLRDLRMSRGVSILFISHDLAVVAQLCDRVAVMFAGEIVESGGTDTVLTNPQSAYTRQLLDAVPRMSPNGEVANARG